MDKIYLKEIAEKYEIAQSEREKSIFLYFKSISTLSVALIGLLIGLKATPIPNQEAKVAFLITVILIALCILFSLATQFYEIVFCNQVVELRKTQLLKHIENPNVDNVRIYKTKGSKLYKSFEIMTFLSLILSIISLIFYVYFLEF